MVVRKMGATALVMLMIASAFAGLVSLPSASGNSGSGTSAAWYYWMDNKDPDPKITYNWINITSDGTVATIAAGTPDEGRTGDIDMGFDFTYFNTTVRYLRIYTNGFISFNLGMSGYFSSNGIIPSATDPTNMTAVFWDDLNMIAGSSILYKCDTASSPKRFIVQYINMVHYGDLTPMTFEAIFYEDGSIVFQYETMGAPGATYATGGSATVGIKNQTGASGVQYSNNVVDSITSGLAIKFAQAGHDVAVRSVTSRSTMPGAQVDIVANLSNYRPVDESNVGVFFNMTDAMGVELASYFTTVATLPANGSVLVTWTITAPSTCGRYTINAFSALDIDPIIGNNKSVGILVVKPIFSLPYSEGFETGGVGITNETYAGTMNFSIGVPTATSAYNGTNCAGYSLNSMYPNSANAALVTPFINLTGISKAYLEFYMWANVEGTTNTWDGGIVEISNDNGTTWMQIDPTNSEGNYNAIISVSSNALYNKYAFCYDTVGWVKKKFTLDSYCGGIVMIRFRFGSDSTGNAPGWLIDSISVKEPFHWDVAVTNVNGTGVKVGTVATLNVTAQNSGQNTATFDVCYQIEHPLGTVVFSGTHTITDLPPMNSSSFEFTYTPAEAGPYYVTAYTTLASDENGLNNASSFKLRSIGVFTLPYFTGFEDDNSNWSTSDASAWSFGVTTGTPSVPAYYGNCAGYNLTGNYIAYANASIITPYFDLTGIPKATLQFEMYCDFEFTSTTYDGGIVEITTDGGANWAQLDPTNAEGNYDSTITAFSNPLYGKYAFCYDTTAGWTKKRFDLSSYIGNEVQIRFRLGSDSMGNARGWFIDNVTLEIPPQIDVGVTSITGTSVLLNTPATLNITSANFGEWNETFDVYYQIERPLGTVVYSGVHTITDLPPSNSSSFEISYTPTEGGPYFVTAYTALATDTNNENNASSFILQSICIFDIPYFTGFEGDNYNWSTPGTPSWSFGVPTGAPSVPAYNGNCAGYNLTGNYSDNSNVSLLTPFFDLTDVTSAVLKFQMYGDFEETQSRWDGGIVEISTDYGATWAQLDPTNAEGNYDNTINSDANVLDGMYAFCYDTSWTEKLFDLSSYYGNVVQMRFRLGSDGYVFARGWFIDNVTVYVPQTDFEILGVTGSSTGFIPLGVETPVNVSVQNNGPESSTAIITLEAINSTGASVWAANSTVVGLGVGENTTVNFVVNVSAEPGSYRLHAYSTYPNDPVSSNNEWNLTQYFMRVYTAPYFDDFEVSMGNWSSEGVNGLWQIGVPLAHSSYSGTNVAGYNLSGMFGNNTDTSLYSSFFDLTQAINGTLEFYLWADFVDNSAADGMLLMVSLDGSEWELLDPTNMQGQYNGTISGSVNPLAGNYAFTGDTVDWEQKTFSVGAFIGHVVQFRFRFASNGAGVSNGTYIDDVRLTIPTGKDVAITNVIGQNVLVVNHSVPMYVTVSNVGAEPITFYLNGSCTNATTGATYSVSKVVSLSVFETKVIEFNLSISQYGLYYGELYADLEGDLDITNNSGYSMLYVLPIYDGLFVDNFDSDLGWCASPWENGWEIGVPGWSGQLWGPAAGYNLSGGNYRNNAEYNLYMPLVNISAMNNPRLSFLSRMAVYSNYQDGGIIEYSLDYGATWQQLDPLNVSGMYDGAIMSATSSIVGQQAFCKDTSGWVEKTFDLSMLSGEVAFRFRFVSDNAYYSSGGWLIDNVTVLPPANDIEVISVNNPTYARLGDTIQVNVTFANNGYETQTFDLQMNLSNDQTGAYAITNFSIANLQYLESRTLTVNVTLNESGWYTIAFEAVLPGDFDDTNNVLSGTVLALAVYHAPYFEPFDNETVPYYHIGYLDSWDYGDPTASGVTPHTGSHCIATSLSGNYASYEESYMIMPIIDLSGMTSANLTFWMYGDFEFTSSHYDGGLLFVSTDGGQSFMQLDPNNTEGNYNGNITGYSNAFYGMQAFSYDTNGWVQKKFNLDAYCGGEIMIVFAFGSDSSGTAKGWYVDDIKISYQVPTDVGINKTIFPHALDCYLDTGNFSAEFKNFGYAELNGVSATITITNATGAVAYSDTHAFVYPLPPYSSVTYSWYWSPIATGNYTVNITVNVTGDADLTNNVVTETLFVAPVYPLHVNEEGYGNITSTQNTKVFEVDDMLTTETYYILSSYPRTSSSQYRPRVSIYNDTYGMLTTNTTFFTFTPSYNGTHYFRISNRSTEVVPFTFIVATRAGLKDLYANGQGYIIDNCSKTVDPANFYIVSLMAGVSYTINGEMPDSLADTYTYYIDASTMAIVSNSDSGLYSLTPAVDTVLIIIVVPYGGVFADGMYNISISPLPIETPTLVATINATSASVVPGGLASYMLTIEATGPSNVTVDISAAYPPAMWALNLSETTITVIPGTPYVVYLNVTAYSMALPGTYPLSVSVSSSIANYSFAPYVTVETVHSVSVNFVQSSIAVLPGQEAVFDVEIISASDVWETVNLTEFVPEAWASSIAPSTELNLAPFGNASVQLTLTIPADEYAGTTTIMMNASYAGIYATGSASVIVSAVYGLDLVVETGKVARPGTEVTFNFTLNSTANADDTVVLALDLPAGWAIVALSTPVSMPTSAQSYVASFVVSIPQNATPGSYNITMHASSQGNASIEVQQTADILVESLYGVTIESPAAQAAEPGQTVTYTMNVTSAWEDTILFSTIGLSAWSPTLSETSLYFGAAGTRAITLTLTIPTTATAGDYNITITATSVNQSSLISSATITTVVFISPYGVSLSQPTNATTEAGGAVTYTFSVTSIGADTVTITTFGLSEWMPTLSETSLYFVAAGTQTVTLTLTPPITASGAFDITVIATSENNTAKTASVIVRTTVNPAPTPVYDVELSIGTSTYTLTPTAVEILPISLTIKNNGTVSDTISVATAGLPSGWSASAGTITLASGATGTLTINVTVPANAADGATTLTFTATSSNTSVSASQNATITINRPDLSIVSVSVSPLSPRVGDHVTITVVVSNVGTGAVSNVNVTIYVNNVAIATKVIDALAAGAQTTLTQTYEFNATGTKVVKAVADVEGKIVEISDNNNEGSAMVTVNKKTTTPQNTILGMDEGTAYMAIGLIAVLAIVCVVVVMFMMRRKKPTVDATEANAEVSNEGKPTEKEEPKEDNAEAPQPPVEKEEPKPPTQN